jgi:hypothetical protein
MQGLAFEMRVTPAVSSCFAIYRPKFKVKGMLIITKVVKRNTRKLLEQNKYEKILSSRPVTSH